MALRPFPKASLSAGVLALVVWAGVVFTGAPPPSVEYANAKNKALTIAYQFIKEHEGIHLCAYKDRRGIPTIGMGHTLNVHMGTCITEDEAHVLFFEDAEEFQSEVRRSARTNLPPATEAAFISFVYNIGIGGKWKTSTIRRHLVAGNVEGACREIRRWTYEGSVNCLENGSGCWGNPKRRANEEELCLMGLKNG